jgi:hypothetical protein
MEIKPHETTNLKIVQPFYIHRIEEFPESSGYFHKGFGWLLLLVFILTVTVVFSVGIGFYLMIKLFMS